MIPPFDDQGDLPPGIHRTDLSTFLLRFSVFDRSDRRIRICSRLELLVKEIQTTQFIRRIYVGGSLVSSKPDPNDFDCVLVLDATSFTSELRPFEYNLISRRFVRRRFGGDILVAPEGTEALQQYLEFFQTNRNGKRIGIVEIEP